MSATRSQTLHIFTATPIAYQEPKPIPSHANQHAEFPGMGTVWLVGATINRNGGD
jgi:hypothetical protein